MSVFAAVFFRHEVRNLTHDLVGHILADLSIHLLPLRIQSKWFPHTDVEIRPFQAFDIFGEIFDTPMDNRQDGRAGVQSDQHDTRPTD